MGDPKTVVQPAADIGSEQMAAAAGDSENVYCYDDRWRTALLSFGMVMLAVVALYWDTAASIVAIWLRSETYAHGFLILPISAFLIWQRRKLLRRMAPTTSPMVLVVLALVLLLWLAGRVAEVQLVQQLVLVGLIPISVVLLFGTAVARAMMFPLGYLIFAVPFGEFLVPPLQDQTAWFAVQALKMSGIPVYWEGLYLTIPGGNFVVAEGCSGIRYLIASIALSCIYAYVTYRSHWRRAGFILLGALTPIVANGIRAYGIVMIAYLSDMRVAVGVDHILYGWLFFGIVIALLFWVGSFWREPRTDDTGEPAALPVEAPALSSNARGPMAFAAIAVALLAGGAYASNLLNDDSSIAAQAVELVLPEASGPWQGPLPSGDTWQPSFTGADETIYRQYLGQAGTTYFYVAYYGDQDNGKELVGSLNRVYDQKQWRRVQDNNVSVTLSTGETVSVAETEIRSEDRRRIVWHWYDINGRLTASRVKAKILEALERLRKRKVDAMLVVIGMDYRITPQEARNGLRDFLENVGAEVVVEHRRAGDGTKAPGGAGSGQPG